MLVLLMIFGITQNSIATRQPLKVAQSRESLGTPAAAVPTLAATPVPTITPLPTHTPILSTGPTYKQICETVNTRTMTDPQIKAYANQFVGQTFTGWRAWVHDVVDNGDGSYDLQLDMQEGDVWGTYELVVEDIPQDLAFRLNVKQQVILSGRIASVQIGIFEELCSPLEVDNVSLYE
jgi:hypothetical protein